jgi:hypothetical protein
VRRARCRRRRWPTAALVALALVAGTRPLHADRWYVHYENAERALAAERWREAVQQLLQAIERKGDSGLRVRSYGMRVVDYFPYLRLGIAYHHLGQHGAALEAFDTEERLGVVRGSAAALGELERYRQLALASREDGAADAAQHGREVLAEGLRRARELDGRGAIDEAMTALAPALAVAPDDAEAVALMASLRERVVARDRAREAERHAAAALVAARRELAAGHPEQAASLLREVLAARPSEEARRLLAEAQDAIAASVESGRRAQRTAEALAAARRLASDGKTAEALELLELVLALEPSNRAAAELQARLAVDRGAAAEAERVGTELAAAGGHLAAGRYEAALAAANRVLAVERSQPRALEVVRRAYAEISRRLLARTPAGAAGGNVPPALRFVDRRTEEAGRLAERLLTPELLLTGIAIDSTPVSIAVVADPGGKVTASSTSQPVGGSFVTEFRLQSRLPPGATTFRVVATDQGGLSSASEYAVLYLRPWYSAPWVLGAGAGLPLAGAAAIAGLRRRRRRQLLRRRYNPYVAGGPVFAEELFFGREALIQRILQTIHTNSLLLFGERRIGKTSILHQLRRRLERLDDPEYRFHPVYVDLQGTPEESFFATLADQVFEALVPLGVGAGRQPALARPAPYSHHDLVAELRGLLRELQERGSKRVKLVLLIDEVDELNCYDPRVNQKLRSLFMKQFAESLVAVVAGVQIRREWEKETSPWYNFFEEVAVEAIDADQARELVLRPIRGVFRVEPGVAERIAARSGAKPYLIQRSCLALVNRLHDEGRRTITMADVDALDGREAT